MNRREGILVAALVVVVAVVFGGSPPVKRVLASPWSLRRTLEEERAVVERERQLLAARAAYEAILRGGRPSAAHTLHTSEQALLRDLAESAGAIQVQLLAPTPGEGSGSLGLAMEFAGSPDEAVGFMDRVQFQLGGVVRGFNFRAQPDGPVQARVDLEFIMEPKASEP